MGGDAAAGCVDAEEDLGLGVPLEMADVDHARVEFEFGADPAGGDVVHCDGPVLAPTEEVIRVAGLRHDRDGAAAQLAALKETSSYARDSFIEDGGWAALAGMDKSIRGAAEMCADELVAMDSIPAQAADTTADTAVVGG